MRVYAAKFFALLTTLTLACTPPPGELEETQQALGVINGGGNGTTFLTVQAYTTYQAEWDLQTIWVQHPPSAAEGCQPARISVTNTDNGTVVFRGVVPATNGGNLVNGNQCHHDLIINITPGHFNVGVYPICANGTHYSSWTSLVNVYVPQGGDIYHLDFRPGPLAQKAKWKGLLAACGRNVDFYTNTQYLVHNGTTVAWQ